MTTTCGRRLKASSRSEYSDTKKTKTHCTNLSRFICNVRSFGSSSFVYKQISILPFFQQKMFDVLNVFPATFGEQDDDGPIPDPRSGEGTVTADPLHVGRDDDHSTKAGEHIPDVSPKDDSK